MVGSVKRLFRILFACALVLGLFPIVPTPAYATDEQLSLLDSSIVAIATDNSGDNKWATSGPASIHGSVSGSKGACSSSSSNSITLKIENGLDVSAQLNFDFSLQLNGGSFQIDGVGYESKESFSNTLGPGESVTITLTSAVGESTAIADIDSINLFADGNSAVAFDMPEGGCIQVDGTSVGVEGLTFSVAKSQPVTLQAAPEEGRKFIAWVNESDVVISKEAATTVYFPKDTTVRALFADASAPSFKVGQKVYLELGKAVEESSASHEPAILDDDGILSAGNYVIPSGATLLIPFDDAGTLYTDSPVNTGSASSKPYCFKKLAMAAGAHILVEQGGAISVSAKHTGAQVPGPGSVTGPYGQIAMEQESSIELMSGASLYCYGFITGEGAITARTGSEVMECFQIRGWRGGTASFKMLRNEQRVFPFSQYYVQNIESRLLLEAGAEERLYTSIYSSLGTESTVVTFFGAEGLFSLSGEDAYMEKTYLPESDRLECKVANGELCVNQITIDSASITSSDYVLPINGNMTLDFEGSCATIKNDLELLPGAIVSIDEQSNLVIEADAKLYIYDRNEWVGNGYVWNGGSLSDFCAVSYSPTVSYVRTSNDLTDATLDVNGTMTIRGSVFVTESGANVCSSKETGKVVCENEASTSGSLYEATQSGTSITYENISIAPLMLWNGDGTATSTADWARGEFRYSAGHDKWIAPGESEHSLGGWEHDGESHWRTCSVCGARESQAAHSLEWEVDAPATEDAAGSGHWECSVCGFESESEEIPQLPHQHVGVERHEAVPATCTSEGSVEYWTCSSPKCAGVKYADAECSRVLETTTLPKDPENHAGAGTEVVDAVDPSCTEAGSTGDTVCAACGAVLVHSKPLAPLGHAYGEYVSDGNATCTQDGTETATCSRCGAKDTRVDEGSAKGHSLGGWEHDGESHWRTCSVCGARESQAAHSLEWEVDAPATEDAAGSGHWECSVCGFESESEEIPQLPHQHVGVERHEAVPATCTSEGSVEYWTCSSPKCAGVKYADAECSRVLETTTLPPLGHNPDGFWLSDSVCHWQTCSRCGEVVNKSDHQMTDVDEGRKCTVCGYLQSIPSAGGGSTAPSEPEGEVTENEDGSTTTTVTEEDGSSVETTVSEDEGVTTVVEKDEHGAVVSITAKVTQEAVEAAGGGAVVLPFAEPVEAKASGEAVAIEVEAPAKARIAVPVAKAEGEAAVAPGAVLALVDAEGNVTVLPKTANDGEALSAEVPGDCTLKVVDASADFPDVAEDAWYAKQGVADFVSARGVMTGVEVAPGSFEFQGDEPTNRGMFVTMLHRLESEPAVDSEGFADVAEGSWYAESSEWAVEAGIATGYLDAEGNATFDGDGKVTREQMATFLFRYANWLGLDTSARADREIEGVSDFAEDALSWAVAEGLIQGDDGTGAIRPGDGATRAEAAVVVMRMIDLMA